MFAKGNWREQLTEVTKCERLGCEKQSSIGTQFCQEHAMMAVGLSVSLHHMCEMWFGRIEFATRTAIC